MSYNPRPMRNCRTTASGFTVIEIVIALGCMGFLVIAIATLTKMAITSEAGTRGAQNAILQRTELRDFLLKNPSGAISGNTCVERLGLSTSDRFVPTQNFPINNLSYNLKDKNVKVEEIYLSKAAAIGTSGNNPVYSAQLVVKQSINDGTTRRELPPSILGIMKIAINASGAIVGCNWDAQSSAAIEICDSTPGMVSVQNSAGGFTCQSVGEVPVPNVGDCPVGTAFDPDLVHCVPSSVSCYRQALGREFDGSTLDCSYIPPAYAVDYGSYSPPTASPGVTTMAPDTSTAQSRNAQPQASPCMCGSSQMQPGGQALCVQARTHHEFFDSYDDMFDAKVCNSAGALQDASPAHYFDEYGDGITFSWRIAACTNFGGYYSSNGIRYSTGKCR